MKKFTLMELLIVITILGILWSMLMPSLQRSRDKARQMVCLSNQNQVSTATFSYMVDDGRYAPQNFAYGDQWVKRLVPAYFKADIRHKSILQCPEGTILPNDKLNTSNVAMNIFLTGKQRSDGSVVTQSYNALQSTPEETCLLMDSYRDWPGAHPWIMTSTKIQTEGYGYKIARHLNSANIMYLDGHAKSLKDTILLDNEKYGNQKDTYWDPTK